MREILTDKVLTLIEEHGRGVLVVDLLYSINEIQLGHVRDALACFVCKDELVQVATQISNLILEVLGVRRLLDLVQVGAVS